MLYADNDSGWLLYTKDKVVKYCYLKYILVYISMLFPTCCQKSYVLIPSEKNSLASYQISKLILREHP